MLPRASMQEGVSSVPTFRSYNTFRYNLRISGTDASLGKEHMQSHQFSNN